MMSLFNRHKISSPMLAQRADKVVGQLVALVDITAHLAYEAFLALGLWLRLHITLVIVVGHSLHVGDHAGFCHCTDEHAVCVKA